MKQNKLYLGLIGGLGDIIYGYLHSDEWKCLADYKKLNPDTIIKAIVVSYNPEAYKIIELNPHIDVVVQHPPKREMRDKKWHQDRVFAQYAEDFSSFKAIERMHIIRERPKLYLTTEEQKTVNKYTLGRTAIVHPFASNPARMPFMPFKYRGVVDKLCRENFNHVICLGGSHIKSFGPTEEYDMQEDFKYQRDGFTNLVNKTNTRLATSLVTKSDLFVGTWSCYGITAWICGIRSIIAVSKDMWPGCSRIHMNKYKNHHKQDTILSIGPRRPTIKSIVRAI